MRMIVGLAVLAVSAGQALAMGGSLVKEADAFSRSAVMVLSGRGSACSGTVVARDLVITAAHCVEGAREFAVAHLAGAAPQLIRVARVMRHPQAKTGSAVSVDLALVKTVQPLPPGFGAARLDDGGEAHATGITRALGGYGITADGADASAGRFREAAVSVLGPLLPRFLRLGAADGSMQAFRLCVGDSGGGVFSAGGSLVAVIAQRERLGGGRQCGPAAQAVRIAPQIGWIREAMESLR